ncbi:uncharacterized protein LOC116377250 isoform X2 [Anarrhichthys ocellatus]|uniref:uncharacterized protein LOC116377250 isoform X2 n=1 Tax=Anarrhichthys ocellatus TaxID=433405 RepID=UPI0012ED4741|nr:uncharacterized protein LOC116377250 isoform X2 [Anarrhichthys ocellatus]
MQVQRLETANQRLERQIQEQLDRKCPRALRRRDGYLSTVSLLQDQIGESLLAQAQVKLQLLSAELTIFDLNARCEKERERGVGVEEDLNNMRLLEEVLKVHTLPELQTLLSDKTQQLMEVHIQRQQDTQVLLAQGSGGVAVEMQSTGSSHLIQQLDDLRQTSVMLHDNNQNEFWFNTQASMLSSPEVTLDPPAGSEVVRAELEDLRRTVATLEEELTHLQALNMELEASGPEQTESFVQQLVDLQQRADGLCRDLDSVLQAAAQQAADHQVLLDIKSRLETEIQDYKRLLDGPSRQGFSSLYSTSNVRSFCGPSSPSAFGRNITVNKTVSFQGGNIRIMRVQNVHIKHPKSLLARSINTSNLTGSFHKSKNQRTGSLSITIDRQSSPVKDKTHSKDSDATQGFTTLVPDKQSARSAAVQAKPESFTSKQVTTEAGLQNKKTGTNSQTEITKNIVCAESEVKEGPCSVTHITAIDPSKEIAAELKKETKTVTRDKMICIEGSFQIKNQDPAQVVSLSLETSAEADGDAGEVGVTASVVSGPPVRSEDSQGKVSGELTLIDDKDIERELKKGEEEVESTLSNGSTGKQNKVMEDAGMGSGFATASSGSPDSKDNHESKTASTEILNKVELEMNKGKVIIGFHDAHKVKVDPNELDNEIIDLAGQEELLSTTKSKKSVSLTNSGVALSSSDHEEILSPIEAPVFLSPTNPFTCLNPETCLSPVETEVLMSMKNQGFCPVDPEEHVQSPDSLLSPHDPEMFLSPNDSDTCLSPVGAKGCLRPNGEEEDEDVCLNLTEARTLVRPVEKYILSTKEEDQSLSFSRDQALPEEENGTIIDSRPTSQGVGLQPSSSLGGFEFGGPGSRSIIADKEEELGFGDLYRKGARDEKRLRDRYKDTSGIADNKDVQHLSRSPGGRYGSEDQKETSIMDSEVRGQKNSDQVFVKSASFGSVPANGGTTFGSQSGGSGMVSDLAASCGGTAANSSRAINGNTEAEVRGRFRHGSGDWMVYGGSLGRTRTTSPSTRNEEESPSGAMPPGTSRPETGRFGSGGMGEWMIYGGSLGRKRSLDGDICLPGEGKEDGPSVFTNPATSSEETGRFSSRGGGEWMVYGGSLGHKSSLPRTGSKERPVAVMLPATNPPDTRRFGSGGSGERMVHSLKRSDSLPIAGSRESQSAAMHLPTSPPETGRFGSRGSGEWTVYGGSTRRVSIVAGSNSEESSSVARQLPTSPPGAPRARRFDSGDSGEWRVYGGTSASNADGVSISANYGQVVSPPSSYTGSRPRLGSAGSGGSVVRRSSSVGSGGRLRSSGSGSKLSSSPGGHMTSSSERFSSTGSGESKPVYSSASGRRSTVGGAGGRSGAVRSTSNQRAPSPGGWLSSSQIGGSRVSSAGSGSKLNSAGSGRTNSTGGRVISSSDRPIRSTGSGAGGNKERISVCKMAALSISAAGRERSQDRWGQAQWSKQQQQQAAATSPLIQRWLVGSTSAEPDGLDDIMRL